jgi:hypothetical protein
MLLRSFVALASAAVIAGCAPRNAVTPGFAVVETAAVDPARTSERIEIDGAHRRLRSVTVMVTGRRLFIERVSVQYSNSDVIEFAVDERVEAGATTRAFDLPGNYRSVRAVEVSYRAETPFAHGLVHLHVYGRR